MGASALGCASVWAAGGAHEHGAAELFLSAEGTDVQISLNLPAQIIVGFETTAISAEQKAAYVKVLGDMYKTKEWEEVRAQNKWVNIYNPGDDFVKFLEKQESEIGGLMKELGFL